MSRGSVVPLARRVSVMVFTAVLSLPVVVYAQSPWERAASNLERTFTGPLARSLALVAIVIGGLLFMYGEAGAKRQISGIVFGGTTCSPRSSWSGCSDAIVRVPSEVRPWQIGRRTGPCTGAPSPPDHLGR